jgi:hypothetical protein
MATAVLLLLVFGAVLYEAGVVAVHLPENRRLVPEYVFAKGRTLGALQFGFELGTGVRTYVPAVAPYVLAVALVLVSSDVTEPVAAAFGFAAGRAIVPWAWLATTPAWQAGFAERASIVRWLALVVVAFGVLSSSLVR